MKKHNAISFNQTLDKRELKKDINFAKKYLKHFIFISFILLLIVSYNYKNFQLNEEITKLNLEKQFLTAKNFQLKQKITSLSSPQRIEKIATQKLKMKPVTYKEVEFLEIK